MPEESTWGVAEFGTALLDAANGALPYIGAGVAGGVVIFAVIFGIRKGLAALKTVAK